MSTEPIDLDENDAAVFSLGEYKYFIRALEWLNQQADEHEEAEWLLLLIRRQRELMK